jgi:hypothetical protein
MHYVLVYYPRFDWKTEESIEAFRRKYDPFAGCWKPHIPFIFPVACSEIEEADFAEHVEAVLRNWKPFRIRIGGFRKSWDHWLFLLLKEGNEEAVALHDELYDGVLSRFLKRDIKYIPHIGIGLFVRKEAGYNVLNPEEVDLDARLYSEALKEAESLNVDSFDTVDRLSMSRMIIKAGGSLRKRAPLNDVLIKTISSQEIRL